MTASAAHEDMAAGGGSSISDQELEALLDISSSLSRSLDLSKVLQTAIEGTLRVLGLDSGAVYLLEDDHLRLGATSPPLPPDFPEEMRIAPLEHHPHIAEALSSAEAVWVPDSRTEQFTPEEAAVAQARDLLSILYLPLLLESRATGTMILCSTESCTELSDHRLSLAKTLANQVALSVGNALLYGSLRESHSRLESIVDARTRELSVANEELDSLNEELLVSNEELQATMEELALINRQLSDATEAKDRFMASMSHELRTPLNSVIGFAGILAHGMAGPMNEEQERQVSMIREAGERLLGLVNGVLDLSKIEAGYAEISSEDFQITAVAAQVVEILRPLAEAGDLTLEFESDADGLTMHSDQQKISQILFNLIGNAIKFTESGGVRVRITSVGDSGVRIAVIDTGVGIRDSELPGLFDPFTQLMQDDSSKPPGTGLGLTLAKEYTELLGGTITVESTEGVGSTFTVELPTEITDLPPDEASR